MSAVYLILCCVCRCLPCHESCDTCSGSNSSQCISCTAGHYWNEGRCVHECPAHHYADGRYRECIECPPGCSECNQTTCISCLDDWHVNSKGRCVPHGSDHCDTGIVDTVDMHNPNCIKHKYFLCRFLQYCSLRFALSFVSVSNRSIPRRHPVQTVSFDMRHLRRPDGARLPFMRSSAHPAGFALRRRMQQRTISGQKQQNVQSVHSHVQ